MAPCRNPLTRRALRAYLLLLTAAFFSTAYGADGVARLDGYTTAGAYGAFSAEGLAAWQRAIPEIQDVTVNSSRDGSPQPALFYAADTPDAKPLLVVLHSWSSGYRQQIDIPFALFAKQNDWVFIHPDYRGAFERPQATASDLAVQDIVDAVNYAQVNANVDPRRIYLTGFSGGGMMALVMAGRQPDLWAAVAAWVPIYDLVDWYAYNRSFPDRAYPAQIAASCGGAPVPGSAAAQECRRRSPSAYLEHARKVPIYLAHGIDDDTVPPAHSLRIFNALAGEQGRLSEAQIAAIATQGVVPPGLGTPEVEHHFADTDPQLLLARTSARATLVLFEGGHDVVYNPGLVWLSEQEQIR